MSTYSGDSKVPATFHGRCDARLDAYRCMRDDTAAGHYVDTIDGYVHTDSRMHASWTVGAHELTAWLAAEQTHREAT